MLPSRGWWDSRKPPGPGPGPPTCCLRLRPPPCLTSGICNWAAVRGRWSLASGDPDHEAGTFPVIRKECNAICCWFQGEYNGPHPIDIQSPRLFRMIHWSVQYKWWFSEFYRGVVCRNCEKGSQLVIVINEINLVMKVVDSPPLTWSKNDWRGNNSLSSTCQKLLHLI